LIPPSGPGRPKSQSKDPHVPPTGSMEPATPADGRFPLDRPRRTSRSPAGRPPLRQGEDQYAGGLKRDAPNSRTLFDVERKTLISLTSNHSYPRRPAGKQARRSPSALVEAPICRTKLKQGYRLWIC